jgi:hypothetical protein
MIAGTGTPSSASRSSHSRPRWDALVEARPRACGYALTLVVVGSAAIAIARPNWVQYALVYARYLVPVVPLLLLLRAEGLVGAMAVRSDALRACAVAAIGVALVASGPLPAQWYAPNQFTSHQRFQFDYDDAHSPYVTQRVQACRRSTASSRAHPRVAHRRRRAMAAGVALQSARVVPGGAPAETCASAC